MSDNMVVTVETNEIEVVVQQGAPGPTGPQGEIGETGATGEAATVEIGTVTTGAVGSSASVTNGGTKYEAVLNFTLPTGATGAEGVSITSATVNSSNHLIITLSDGAELDVGYVKGDTGETGATGATGAIGADGSNGTDGTSATIAVGTVTTGAAGSSASVINSGTESAAVLDFEIPKGDDGATGPGANMAPDWVSDTVYALYQMVMYNEVLYRCTTAHTSGTSFESSYFKVVSTEAGNPPGAILQYSGSSAPTGYLLCDGSAVSRTTYADLYSVIGTVYGSGDGSATFNLPSLVDKFVLGKGSTYSTLAATGGETTHTLTTSEMPAHTHTVTKGTTTLAAGAMALSATSSAGTVTSASTGGGGAHNNMPPYIVLNYIIKY